MTDKIGYVWHLRRLMAERGMFATTDLVPLLAERGIGLSREQVYRLVTRTPERLNLNVLVALCDILDCRADDLITPLGAAAKTITTSAAPPAVSGRVPAAPGYCPCPPSGSRSRSWPARPAARPGTRCPAAVPGPARPAGGSGSSPG